MARASRADARSCCRIQSADQEFARACTLPMCRRPRRKRRALAPAAPATIGGVGNHKGCHSRPITVSQWRLVYNSSLCTYSQRTVRHAVESRAVAKAGHPIHSKQSVSLTMPPIHAWNVRHPSGLAAKARAGPTARSGRPPAPEAPHPAATRGPQRAPAGPAGKTNNKPKEPLGAARGRAQRRGEPLRAAPRRAAPRPFSPAAAIPAPKNTKGAGGPAGFGPGAPLPAATSRRGAANNRPPASLRGASSTGLKGLRPTGAQGSGGSARLAPGPPGPPRARDGSGVSSNQINP